MKYFALLKDKIEQTLKKTKNTLILTGGYNVPSLHGNNAAECG